MHLFKDSPHITLVATFASGIPVAFETNGTVLEALDLLQLDRFDLCELHI